MHATCDEMIHEAGIPAPNIDHSAAGVESGGVEQAKRQRGLLLKPTDISRALRFEHVFPVLFAFHLRCSNSLSTLQDDDHRSGDGHSGTKQVRGAGPLSLDTPQPHERCG